MATVARLRLAAYLRSYVAIAPPLAEPVVLARRARVRSLTLPWSGYGAARRAGAEQLSGHDYLFYLDELAAAS